MGLKFHKIQGATRRFSSTAPKPYRSPNNTVEPLPLKHDQSTPPAHSFPGSRTLERQHPPPRFRSRAEDDCPLQEEDGAGRVGSFGEKHGGGVEKREGNKRCRCGIRLGIICLSHSSETSKKGWQLILVSLAGGEIISCAG